MNVPGFAPRAGDHAAAVERLERTLDTSLADISLAMAMTPDPPHLNHSQVELLMPIRAYRAAHPPDQALESILDGLWQSMPQSAEPQHR